MFMTCTLDKFTPFLSLLLCCFICPSNSYFSDRSTPNFNITNAPFTVLVLCENSKYYCSGVIIDFRWVLTAAHCFFDLSGIRVESDYSVLVVAGTDGINYAEADINSGQAQILRSDKLIVHERYSWLQKFVNDMALIRLERDLNLTARVALAVLDSTDDVEPVLPETPENHVVVVNLPCKGYGFGDDKGDKRVLEQEYIVNKHCHCLEGIRSYMSPVDILRQRNIFLCTSDLKVIRRGLCDGDNGGPLMCGMALRGIATTVFHYKDKDNCEMLHYPDRTECGSPQTLDVFTDVCYFSDFLTSHVPRYPHLDELCRDVSKYTKKAVRF